MSRSPPQMHINMPLITSDLFFSSERDGSMIDQAGGLAERQTPSSHSDVMSPGIVTDEDRGSAVEVAEDVDDADAELFVDLSRELAAIEGSEVISAFHPERTKDVGMKEMFPLTSQRGRHRTVHYGTEMPTSTKAVRCPSGPLSSQDRNWAIRLQHVEHLSTSWDTRMEGRFHQQLEVVPSRAPYAATRRQLFAGDETERSSAVLHESLGDAPTGSSGRWLTDSGKDGADGDCDTHTDSDLASLLGSIEHVRRRIRTQDESESRIDEALYAGGLSHFARSAAATAPLLPRRAGAGSHGEITKGKSPAAGQGLTNGPSGGEQEVGRTRAAGCRDVAVSGESSSSCAPFQNTSQNRTAGSEGAQSSLPEEPKACTGTLKAGQESAPHLSQAGCRDVSRVSGMDAAAEMKRSALLSAALADMKEEQRSLQEELAKARSMALISTRMMHKLKEWRDLESINGNLSNDPNDQGTSPAEKCLQELEAILSKAEKDGHLHANELDSLQQELAACKEAKRLAELQGESLRNEIAFLQLVNGKITEKREAEHSTAVDALKEHLEKKSQETKTIQEEKEALRRELDHLKTIYAEQLAAADASKATLQHELNATKHLSTLRVKELEDTVERLCSENQQLRYQKEAAEARLRGCAQAERLAQLERKEMQEKQEQLAAQHQALRKSLKEIRNSAVEARRKWLHRQSNGDGEEGSKSDSDWVFKEVPDHTAVSLNRSENVDGCKDGVDVKAESPMRAPAFRSTDGGGHLLPASSTTDVMKGGRARLPEKLQLNIQEGTGGSVGGVEKSGEGGALNGSAAQDPKTWTHLSFPSHLLHPQQQHPKELIVRTPELAGGHQNTVFNCRDLPPAPVSDKSPGDRRGQSSGSARENSAHDKHVERRASLEKGPLIYKHPVSDRHENSVWDAGEVLNAVPTKGPTEHRPDEVTMRHQWGLRQTAETPRSLSTSREIQNEAQQLTTSPVQPLIPADLRDNSSRVLPSSISEEIEATNTDEPASARRLYSEKLQEVEEANEMLRRTNLLVDKENAFLQQTLQELAASSGKASGDLGLAEAGRMSEAYFSSDLSSPSHRGRETARSPLSRREVRPLPIESPRDIARKMTPLSRVHKDDRRERLAPGAASSLKAVSRCRKHPRRARASSDAAIKVSPHRVIRHFKSLARTPREVLYLGRFQRDGLVLLSPRKRRKSKDVLCPSVAPSPPESARAALQEEQQNAGGTAPAPFEHVEVQQANLGKAESCAEVPSTGAQDSLMRQCLDKPGAPPSPAALVRKREATPREGPSACLALLERGADAREADLRAADTRANESHSSYAHTEQHMHPVEPQTGYLPACCSPSQPADSAVPQLLEVSTEPTASPDSSAYAAEESQRAALFVPEASKAHITKAVVLGGDTAVSLVSPNSQKKVEGPRLFSVETHAPTPRSGRLAAQESRGSSADSGNPRGTLEDGPVSIDTAGSGQDAPKGSGIAEEESRPLSGKGPKGSGIAGEESRPPSGKGPKGNGDNQFLDTDKKNNGKLVDTPAGDQGATPAAVALSEGPLDDLSPPPASAKYQATEGACKAVSSQTAKATGTGDAEVVPVRCTKSLSESSSTLGSARRLVAEAGESFKLKFLQYRSRSALLTERLADGLDSLLVTPTVDGKTFRSPATHRQQKAELCLLSSNVLFSRSSNNSSWSLPSSRRCEACMATACDRILADASLTPVSALHKLASPSRRANLREDTASDIIPTEVTPTAAAAAIKKLLSSARSCTLGEDTTPHPAVGSPERLLMNKGAIKKSAYQDAGVASLTVSSKIEKKPPVSADARELLRLLSRYISGALPKDALQGMEGKSKEVAEPSRGRKLRSSSTSRALHAASRSAGATRDREHSRLKASSTVRGVPSSSLQTSSGGRARQVSAAVVKHKIQSRTQASQDGRLTGVTATAGHPSSTGGTKIVHALPNTDSSATERAVDRKLTSTLGTSKASGLRKQKPLQRSKADGSALRSTSPLIRQEKLRPPSASRGRYPGERPPWDFSSAPIQAGPRMPFKSLLKKEQIMNRESDI